MRPVIALLVAGGILAGLQLYMVYRPQPVVRVTERAEAAAAGTFTVEITLTFDAGPDAFALDTSNAASLLVQLRGRDLLRQPEPISAGEAIEIAGVLGVVTGNNEFYVQATPQDTSAQVSRALRVRILRNGNPLADTTLWSEPGEIVQGVVVVRVPDWVGEGVRSTSSINTSSPTETDSD